MAQRQIHVGDRHVNVQDVDFEIAEEQWSRYKVLDGGEVRLKTTPIRIYRVIDDQGRPAIDETGDPVYVVNHTTQVIGRI